MKPLFIPLYAHHFDRFAAGTKEIEYRPAGRRWNARVCVPGRAVTLSRGYGKQRRLSGVITAFNTCSSSKVPGFRDVYPGLPPGALVACIHIKVEKETPP